MYTVVLFTILTLTWLLAQHAQGESTATEPTSLTRTQISETLDAHNAARRTDGVQQDLEWAPDLAAIAQEWAEIRSEPCDMVHRQDSDLGENIFWASPVMFSDGRREVQDIAPSAVVEAWVSEKADYHYDTNSCNEGKMCGHYTQVVWGQTREVGCGMKVCPDNAQVWVCNYRPAGNVVGQRPW